MKQQQHQRRLLVNAAAKPVQMSLNLHQQLGLSLHKILAWLLCICCNNTGIALECYRQGTHTVDGG